MLTVRLTRRGATTSVRRLQLSGSHTLEDLHSAAEAGLGLTGRRWSVSLSWPAPERASRLAAGHPTLRLPLSELSLHAPMGFVVEQGPRERVDGLIEAIRPDPGPESPTVVEATDDDGNTALRALRAELDALGDDVPPPDGIDADALDTLRAASRTLFELREQGYGRLPGGPPDPQVLGLAMLEVARAWPGVLRAPMDILDRQRLSFHLRRAFHPPDTLLHELLGYRWPGGAPPEGEESIQALCAPLRDWSGEHVVVLHARSLVRVGRRDEAVALLLEHGSSPEGPSALDEQVVSVAEGLAEAGATEEAAARLRAVATRVWGDRAQRKRALNLLRGLLEVDEAAAVAARQGAADARRSELMAKRPPQAR